MATVRACPIPDGLFAIWERQIVSEQAPFFLPEALRSELPSSAPMLSRTAFRTRDWPLALVDSYRTYAVAPEAKWVALLSPAMFDALPPTTQTALVQAQWRLHRGQVYPWSSVRRYLADWEGEPWMEVRRAETDEGAVLLLDTAVWERLTPAARRGWLRDFVQQQQPPYDWATPAAMARHSSGSPSASRRCSRRRRPPAPKRLPYHSSPSTSRSFEPS